MPDCIETAFIDIPNGASCKFIVGVVYRPPDGNLLDFNVNYSNLLDKKSWCRSNCYIAGDFSINLLNCDSHSDTEHFPHTVSLHYQFPVITRPTHFCPTTSTLIDNVFVNNLNIDSYAVIIISDLSDHLPLYISENKLSSNTCKNIVKSYKDINNIANLTTFHESLANVNWYLNQTSWDANVAYDNFILYFTASYNECFPIIHKKALDNSSHY